MPKPIRIVSILVIVLHMAKPAVAQSRERSQRSFRGLFGPTEADQSRAQALEFSFSLYHAVDDNSQFESGGDVFDATLQAQRPYQGARAGVSFRRRRPRTLIAVDGSSALRYYADLHDVTTRTHGGGISLQLLPSRRWRFQFSQSASYSPYYQLALVRSVTALSAPDTSTTSPDYSVAREDVMIFGSFAGVTYLPSRRAEMTLSYGLRQTDFEGSDFSARSAGGGITYHLSQDVGLRLGYRYGLDVRSGETPIRNDNLDIGLDYRRSFAFSPRTSFSLSSGSAVVSAEEGRRAQVTGAVRLSRQLSRLWATQVVYERGVLVLENAPRPYSSSTVTSDLSGYFTPRISLRWSPSYARGVQVTDSSKAYYSYSSQTQLNVAVGRHWAVFIEHFQYEFRFSADADLPPALAAGLARRGVRAGLTLWTPLVR